LEAAEGVKLVCSSGELVVSDCKGGTIFSSGWPVEPEIYSCILCLASLQRSATNGAGCRTRGSMSEVLQVRWNNLAPDISGEEARIPSGRDPCLAAAAENGVNAFGSLPIL